MPHMNKTSHSPRFIKAGLKTLATICLIGGQSIAADYYHLGGTAATRMDGAQQYSTTDGSTTPATINPGASDNLFFYNSTVTGSANMNLETGPYPLSFNSMTFRNNAGTTDLNRSSYNQYRDRENATVVSIGKGGITMDASAGAVTIGGKDQRVIIGAVADFTITNNSSKDLTFKRVFDGRTNNTTHTITVTGSGAGNTVFDEGIKMGAHKRNLAMNINTSGTGVVKFEGKNTYTGPTNVTAGKLFINGDASDATGLLSVSADATLGGIGPIGSDVAIENNGCLEFHLSTSPDSRYPMSLAASRTLTFAGNSVLTITSQEGATIGKYKLITAQGGILGKAPATLKLPDGWKGKASIVGNDLVLHITTVGKP